MQPIGCATANNCWPASDRDRSRNSDWHYRIIKSISSSGCCSVRCPAACCCLAGSSGSSAVSEKMKQKTTGIWFVLAASLFAFIWLYQKYLQPAASTVNALLPGLRAVAVTRIQVSPAGQREISVVRSNGVWLLQKPLIYPAQ